MKGFNEESFAQEKSEERQQRSGKGSQRKIIGQEGINRWGGSSVNNSRPPNAQVNIIDEDEYIEEDFEEDKSESDEQIEDRTGEKQDSSEDLEERFLKERRIEQERKAQA